LGGNLGEGTRQQHDVGSIRMLPGGDRREKGLLLGDWVDSGFMMCVPVCVCVCSGTPLRCLGSRVVPLTKNHHKLTKHEWEMGSGRW